MIAARSGHTRLSKHLVTAHGCDVHAADEDGATVLHWAIIAAADDHCELARWLVTEKQADPSVKDKNGNSAMHYAACCGRTRLLQWLVETPYFMDLSDTNAQGHDALAWAEIKDHPRTAKWVEKELVAQSRAPQPRSAPRSLRGALQQQKGTADPASPPVAPTATADAATAGATASSASKPLVICGPSGCGKGTLISRLMADEGVLAAGGGEQPFGFSVSHTSRPPRPGEVDGTDYHYVSVPDMEKDIAAGLFLEHAHVHGKYYGTSFAAVQAVVDAGKICIIEIDIQGVQKVKQHPDLQPHYLFVSPPSMEVLEQRLRGRGTESEDQVQERMKNALAEMEYGKEPGAFDAVLVNDDLDRCYDSMLAVLQDWYPQLNGPLKLVGSSSV